MQAIWRSLLIGVCLSSLGAAQHFNRSPDPIQREFVLPVPADQQSEERARARAADIQFRQRMNKIVGLWKQLVDEYTTKDAFNVHTARELSKAFRELERTESWPKPKK